MSIWLGTFVGFAIIAAILLYFVRGMAAFLRELRGPERPGFVHPDSQVRHSRAPWDERG